MKRRNVFMADKMWDRLQKLADETGLTMADLLRRAVLELLEKMEKKDERGQGL